MAIVAMIPVDLIDLQCTIEKCEFSIEHFLQTMVKPCPGIVEVRKFGLKNRANIFDRLGSNFRDMPLRFTQDRSELWKSSIDAKLRSAQWAKGYLFPA